MSGFRNHEFPFDQRLLSEETLFSYYCRQHYYWGYSNRYFSKIILPKSFRASIKYHFLCMYDEDESSIETPILQLLNHTITPYFAPFQTPANVRCLTYFLGTLNISDVNHWVDVITNNHRIIYLKSCQQCIIEDESKHGIGYWHLPHQYPLATYCLRHFHPLDLCVCKGSSSILAWPLPIDFKHYPNVIPSKSSPTTQVRILLTAASIALARLGFVRFLKPEIAARIYHQQMHRFENYPRSLNRAVHSYNQFTKLCGAQLAITCNPKAKSGSGNIFISDKLGSSPLLGLADAHLLMITWLFGSFDCFMEAYDRLDTESEAEASLQ